MGARLKTDAVPRKRCAVLGDGRRCGAHRKGPHPDLKSRRVSWALQALVACSRWAQLGNTD